MLRCFWIILYGMVSVTAAFSDQADHSPTSSGDKDTTVTEAVAPEKLLAKMESCVSNFDRSGVRECVEQIAADRASTKT